MNLETLIDQAQEFLHDDGVVWPRAELLRWANDGYRQLCRAAACIVRPFQQDVPGRVAASCSQPWERIEHRGLNRIFSRQASTRNLRVCFLWEVEALAGISPTQSYDVTTQHWEEAYSDDTDAHFRFALPRQADRPLKVYWDDKRLAHTSTRELDESYDRWWRDTGEPIATLPGVGEDKTLEVYLLQTTYVQSWYLKSYETGVPRQFSSDASRTYAVSSLHTEWDYGYTNSADSGMAEGTGLNIAQTLIETGVRGLFSWEADTTATTDDTAGTIYAYPWEGDNVTQLGVGLTRHLTSTDRQYLGVAYDSGQDLLGTARRFASGDDALTIWQNIIPSRPLTEYDEPDLLPDQLHKYLRFYVLAQAFGRKGEGFRPDLSEHFAALYKLGEGLLAMLGTPSVLDRVYAREQVKDASIKAPPRVRFPATYQRVS